MYYNLCYMILLFCWFYLFLFIPLFPSRLTKFAEFAVLLFLLLLLSGVMETGTDNAVDHVGRVYLLASEMNIGSCLMNE